MKVVVFSFNNYEGRKRPSKMSGGTMLERISKAAERFKPFPIYLYYKDRGTFYYVRNTNVHVKQPDGSWKRHISYVDCHSGVEYCRPSEMFKQEHWSVLSGPQAMEKYDNIHHHTFTVGETNANR